MFIYDKKDEKIEIYNMVPKEEEIRKYRKGVLSRHKDDGLIYSVKTNCYRVKESFDRCSEMVLPSLDFYNVHGSYFGTEYSELNLNDLDKEVLERYLSGQYDDLEPINICKYGEIKKEIVHRFLRTGGLEEKRINCHTIYEFNNLIDLPRELYLLQLLLLGKYKDLVDENIRKQISLFDVSYLKSISTLDIKNMIETGLLYGSLDEVNDKADIGKRILSKRK